MMSPSVLRGALEGDLLGAGGVALGWRWADPAVGLVITVVILGVLRSAVTQVSARLMDAVDPALVDRATKARWQSRALSAASAHVSPIEAHQEIEPPRSLSSDA
jgi:divalent metal cation (Fe/Co/Zn/Cd) transporter